MRRAAESHSAYCDAEGEPSAGANPNGSARNVAGVYNAAKTMLGQMLHPENAIEPLYGLTDGRAFFADLAQALS